MREMMNRNEIEPDQMVSCIFSCTADLDAQFPAVAARDLGLNRVPLLCTREMDVPGALERVIRVLLHYYDHGDHRAQHVYLREARRLREDLDSAQ
jgi:chorismate mutase